MKRNKYQKVSTKVLFKINFHLKIEKPPLPPSIPLPT